MSKRPRVHLPSAVDLLTPARLTRETMQAGGADFSPMVLFFPQHGRPMMAVLEEDEGDTLEQSVGLLLAGMREKLGPALLIAVTTDAFVKNTPEPLDFERGDLARAFEDGDPGVTEQMVVVAKRRNEPAEMATQTYRYIPSEGWEWDEPEVIENHVGPVIDILNWYI